MRDDQRWALSSLAFSIAFSDLACFVSLSFAGLVVLARSLNPIPSRTRPLNSSAPMVLWLKPWESRSLPGLPRTRFPLRVTTKIKRRFRKEAAFFFVARSIVAHEYPSILHPWSKIALNRSFPAIDRSAPAAAEGEIHASNRLSARRRPRPCRHVGRIIQLGRPRASQS